MCPDRSTPILADSRANLARLDEIATAYRPRNDSTQIVLS
jgi:hypothetical protein